MSKQLITAPSSEPVTRDEVKLDARVDGFDLDATIDLLITAARRKAETLTGRAIMPQTWDLYLDDWPTDGIKIGMMPLQSITHIKYDDNNGDEQTVDSSVYSLDANKIPGWVYLNDGESWPTGLRGGRNKIRVRFVAGYADAESVPAELKYWIRVQAAAAVQAQSAQVDASVSMPFIDQLLEQFMVVRA